MLQRVAAFRREERGFTLIELMIVVLIIAVLVAISLPMFLGGRERARNRLAQSNLRNGLMTAKAHYADVDTYAGFTKARAVTLEGSLSWNHVTDGVTAGTISIDTATSMASLIQLVTVSESGRYYCIREVIAGTSVTVFRGDGGSLTAAQSTCATGTAWS